MGLSSLLEGKLPKGKVNVLLTISSVNACSTQVTRGYLREGGISAAQIKSSLHVLTTITEIIASILVLDHVLRSLDA